MAKIGKDLIQMLMFALYPEPETIFREYIQNASDSIKEAVNQNIIDKDDGHISIEIKPEIQTITITDNGIGINSNVAESVLKDIAQSTKKNKSYNAGFYGIGRLVGAGYCRQLTFRTSVKGEENYSELIYDVEKIRAFLKDPENEMTAEQVIENSTEFRNDQKEDANEHYFTVILKDILPEYRSLLEKDRVNEYLTQVAPVAYRPEFLNTLVLPSIYETAKIDPELAELANNIETVKLSLNENVDIRKNYSYTIDGTDEEISSLRYFLLKGSSGECVDWGWDGIRGFERQIPDFNKNEKPVLTRGLRLRVHNIQIGTANFFDGAKYFKQARSNKYFNGEIHIINENIKPTTDRSDLAPSPEALDLKEQLTKFFNTELQTVYQIANKAKNSVKEYERVISEKNEIEQKKITSDYTKEDKTADLKRIAEKEEVALKSVTRDVLDRQPKTPGEEAMLNLYKSQYSNVKDNKTSSTLHVSEKHEKNKEKPKIDPLVELESIYPKEQMQIIRRIFEIIDNNYSRDSYQKLVGAMKSTIIKGLKK